MYYVFTYGDVENISIQISWKHFAVLCDSLLNFIWFHFIQNTRCTVELWNLTAYCHAKVFTNKSRKSCCKLISRNIFQVMTVIFVFPQYHTQCGNYGILLPPFFRKNSVKELYSKLIWRKKIAWQWISRFSTAVWCHHDVFAKIPSN